MLKKAIIILAAFIIAILGIDRMPQLVTVAMLCFGSIYFMVRKIDAKMRKKIIFLFLAIFLLQVIISLFMYTQTVDTKYYGFSYKGDDYVYGYLGIIVGGLWRRGIFMDLEKELRWHNLIADRADLQNYQLYNAFMFWLFGNCAGQILLIINCFLHAIIIIPVYFICRDLNIRNSVITFTLFLFLFWPSTFYWSLFNFKEPMFLFSLLAVFSLQKELIGKPNLKNLFIFLIFLFLSYCVRRYAIIVFLAMTLYFFIFSEWKHKKITFLLFSFLFILWQISTGPHFSGLHLAMEKFPLTVFTIRRAGLLSNTGYFTNLLTFTWRTILLYFPFGVLATLFLPFLVRPLSLSHVVANVESMVWWCFLPLILNGIWISARTELKKTFPILFMFFSWLAILALTQGSMGTLVRQKAIIYYLGFIFMALAVDRVGRRIEEIAAGRF